jgi:hypothetical protein
MSIQNPLKFVQGRARQADHLVSFVDQMDTAYKYRIDYNYIAIVAIPVRR